MTDQSNQFYNVAFSDELVGVLFFDTNQAQILHILEKSCSSLRGGNLFSTP